MNILFLGGDMRQRYASEYLNQNKYLAKAFLNFDIDEIETDLINADVIALPLPSSSDGIHLNMSQNSKNRVVLSDILKKINRTSIIIGGKLPLQIKELACERGISTFDYMDIEPFQIQNALLSAEGAIYYAKQKLERSIHGACVVIFGSGRIGRMLAFLLNMQGAKVTVIARRDADLTWSRLIGYNTLKMSRKTLPVSIVPDIVFNTIPYHVIDESFLNYIDANTIVLDLASFPYGIDEDLIKKFNLKYYREPGIPGRYAPKSAGEIIGQTIIDCLNNKEDLL